MLGDHLGESLNARRRRARHAALLAAGLAALVVVVAGVWWTASPGPAEDEPAAADPAARADGAGNGASSSRAAAPSDAATSSPSGWPDTLAVTASAGEPAAADDPDTVAPPPPVSLGPVPQERFAVGVEAVHPSARVQRPDSVRGIYLNAWAAGSRRRLARLVELADTTEVNTFVVDVKDATGRVSYPSTIPFVREIDADGEIRIRDVRAVLDTLRAHGIYPVARIVVFKDPHLAERRPDWAVQHITGGVWRDHNDEVWVDPFNANVWRYNIAIAREAVALGFAEVQWDYVRFPDVPRAYMETAWFPAREGRIRVDAIRAFVRRSAERLADMDVPITADVFGLTVSARNDMGIGQSWERMVDVTDVLLPMIYPSHFAPGSYGIARPNASPYTTVRTAIRHARARTDSVPGGAEIRPWLQDFSLGEPSYGPAHVRAQIRAVHDAGLTSWVLWNSSSRYTAAALAPEGGPPPDFPLPDEAILVSAPPDSLPAPTVDLVVPTPTLDVPSLSDPLPYPDTLLRAVPPAKRDTLSPSPPDTAGPAAGRADGIDGGG